ncbi:ankyrin repeat domain-containing protein [Actinokineospora inagensis]|uniref:ankyrin repeat domain-containing protein n=1 Tax=Actinokineospora inagensis TaxID=103730 RepID=UPI0004798CAB|nr:ankyrin repeat domain-containing protein [Actinokineospora inagensis]
MVENSAWEQIGWADWGDLGKVRAVLAAGADPNAGGGWRGSPLHMAAEDGSPEVVAELLRVVDDVDPLSAGVTPLWPALFARRFDNARFLVAAGADTDRHVMAGWTPNRIMALARDPLPRDVLSAAEVEAVVESRRLIAALGDLGYVEGLGLCCARGVDVAEAVRRLDAEPVDGPPADPWSDLSGSLLFVGLTDVPGGCVVAQPWGFQPNTPGVSRRLSRGTRCYSLYANPKSGNQGSLVVDGEVVGWDLHPGGDPSAGDSSREVLLAYLYQRNAIGYCCAHADLQPVDGRAITGEPDVWVRLPDVDYWS